MPKRLLSTAAHERRGGRYRCGQPQRSSGLLRPRAGRFQAALPLGARGSAGPWHHGAVRVQPAALSPPAAPVRCVSTEGGNNDKKKKIKKEKQMQGLE